MCKAHELRSVEQSYRPDANSNAEIARQKRKSGEEEHDGEERKRDCKHTDTTRSDVSRNHDGALSGLELVEHPVTLVLLLVTVNSCNMLARGLW